MPESPPIATPSDEFMYETRHVILNYMGLIPNQHSELSSSGSSNYGSWPRKSKTSTFGYGTWPKKSQGSSQMPKGELKECSNENSPYSEITTNIQNIHDAEDVTSAVYSIHSCRNTDYHDDNINEDDLNSNALPTRTDVDSFVEHQQIDTEENATQWCGGLPTVPPNSYEDSYNTVRQRILNNLNIITDHVDGSPNGNIIEEERQSPARPTSLSISPGPASTFNFIEHLPEVVSRGGARKRKLDEISKTPDMAEMMPEDEDNESDDDDDKVTCILNTSHDDTRGRTWRNLAEVSSVNPDGSSKRSKCNTPGSHRQHTISGTSTFSTDFGDLSPTSETSSLNMSMRSTTSNNVVDVQTLDWDFLSKSSHSSYSMADGEFYNIAQPYVDIAMPLREELDYEKSLTDYKKYDTLPRHCSKLSRQSSHQSTGTSHRALSPESEVARRLNIISELVMQEYGHRLALEGAVQQVARLQRDQVSYASLRQILIQCGLMDGELRGWPMVAILMLFTQKVAFTLLKKGERGLGMLVDYTSQIIADAAADFILQQGGWESVFDSDVVSAVMSSVSQSSESSVCTSPRKSQPTSQNCSPKHLQQMTADGSSSSEKNAKDIVDSLRSEIQLLRQHSENLSAEIERDRLYQNAKSFSMTALGVALLGVAAGLLYTYIRRVR